MLVLAIATGAQPLVVPNRGQWSGDFSARTDLSDGAVFWRHDGYRINLTHPKHRGGSKPSPHFASTDWPASWPDAYAVFVEFVGAQQSAKVVGSDPSPSPRNYLLGSDPSTWQSNVPEYRDWRVAEVYPYIDYVLHAHDQVLKSEWKLGPNANPDLIRIRVRGCVPRIDSEGQLILEAPF